MDGNGNFIPGMIGVIQTIEGMESHGLGEQSHGGMMIGN